MFNKLKRGFTLIEVLLVLAIAAVLTIAGITLYDDYKDKDNAKSFYLDILAVSRFVEDLYARGSDLEGINAAALHQLGFKTNGFKFDSTTQQFKHIYTPSGYSGGQIGEIWIDAIPYRSSLAYTIRVFGIKKGYLCSEVAKNAKRYIQFNEIQIAGTTLTQGAANTITDKMIDDACNSQPIISITFIKDNYI